MTRLLQCACAGWLVGIGMVLGQQPADPLLADSQSIPPAVQAGAPLDGGNGGSALAGVSANPGANNIVTGTGALGRFLGFPKDSGVYLGGTWIGDGGWLMSGGR